MALLGTVSVVIYKSKAVRIAGLCVASAVCSNPSAAQEEGQRFRIGGVIEHYFGGTLWGSDARADMTARWIQVKGETARLGFTLGTFERPNFRALDENYLESGGREMKWRVGRIRSPFGHGEWSDQWYNGFTSQPLMRVTRFSGRLMLARFDTGVDFRGGDHALEYRLGLVDVSPGRHDVAARRPNHLVGRVQSYQRGIVLGLSGLVNRELNGTALVNFDWRWSSPEWVVRGELLRGRAGGFTARGEYLDIYFHPMKQFRTTAIARLEESGNSPQFGQSGSTAEPTSAPPRSRLATMGVKQQLSRDITLSATHSWGNRSAAMRGATGWAFQAIHFLRF